jgi:hypothetical protein
MAILQGDRIPRRGLWESGDCASPGSAIAATVRVRKVARPEISGGFCSVAGRNGPARSAESCDWHASRVA